MVVVLGEDLAHLEGGFRHIDDFVRVIVSEGAAIDEGEAVLRQNELEDEMILIVDELPNHQSSVLAQSLGAALAGLDDVVVLVMLHEISDLHKVEQLGSLLSAPPEVNHAIFLLHHQSRDGIGDFLRIVSNLGDKPQLAQIVDIGLAGDDLGIVGVERVGHFECHLCLPVDHVIRQHLSFQQLCPFSFMLDHYTHQLLGQYWKVPLALRLLPKALMLDCLARRVPNWIAVFLNLLVSFRPSWRATSLSNSLSPSPFGRVQSANRSSFTLDFRQSTSGEYKKGYLIYFDLWETALSSLPKFLIHSLSKSNIISRSCSSTPPLKYDTLYLEQPLKSSSAPSPDSTTLAFDLTSVLLWYNVPLSSLARARIAEMLKSMWVFLGYIRLMCSFSIASIESRVQSLRMRLQGRLERDRSSLQALRAVMRSGALWANTMLTKSISASSGRIVSSRRAIRVESRPPENSTATWPFVKP